jgi:dipeptidyl-peptidase-4
MQSIMLPKQRAQRVSVLLAILVLIEMCTPAGASSQLTQTLNDIFNQHEYETKTFGPARWLDGGEAYSTLEPSAAYPHSDAKDIIRYETASGARTVLVSASRLLPATGAQPLRIDDYAWSKDHERLLIYSNSQKVWRQNTRGDYWVLDLEGGRLQKLGGEVPPATLMFAQFSPNGQRVAYVHEHNIYVEDLASGRITPLTTDGSSTLINGTSDWVNEEEFDIRNGFRWSPDGQSIAYWQFDTTGVGIFTLINDTIGEYPALKTFPYPQVGTQNSAVRIGVVSVNGGPTRWMHFPGDPHEHYIARMDWACDSDQLVLEVLNRLQSDNQVLLADVATGAVRKVLEDGDPAWLDVVKSLDWADHGRSLLWLSERDGWRHIYKVSRDGGPFQILTHGAWDVMEQVSVDNHGGWIYYTAARTNAAQRYLYRVRLDGSGSAERITPANEPGTHSYDISPDGEWAFHTYSTSDLPPVTDLIRLPSHQVRRVLESNSELAQRVRALISSPTKFFQITIDGGVKLDGWMMLPPHFDAAKKYPVLTYVYGEPAAVTVVDKWQGDRNLFHRAVAGDGYIILSFDNEGTPASKGRAWRKAVFGSLGPLSSLQQSQAILAFAKEHAFIDTSRMAIWGWSGGGSNTLNLMFRYPGVYGAGMAVAPMADQRHYDTIYQERYMALPRDNAKGYYDGSPINFAQGLRGKLLIVHGSGDDNCHFQVTELLINRLVELGKSFTFMDYPNRTHAISEGPGTPYHLYHFLSRFLEEHVVPGGLPR